MGGRELEMKIEVEKPTGESNMELRVFPDFDYGSPGASAISSSISPKRPWKKRHTASSMPMRWRNKSLQLKNPI
jgi:hypothetical protein